MLGSGHQSGAPGDALFSLASKSGYPSASIGVLSTTSRVLGFRASLAWFRSNGQIKSLLSTNWPALLLTPYALLVKKSHICHLANDIKVRTLRWKLRSLWLTNWVGTQVVRATERESVLNAYGNAGHPVVASVLRGCPQWIKNWPSAQSAPCKKG